MADITQDVIDTLIAESGGEGYAGLVATAWAMQQRAAARGQTLDQVIRSGFDGYTNPGSGSRKNQQNPTLRAQAERILQGVTSGTIPNPVPGADHFLSGDVMPDWANKMRLVATVGGHRYYASGNVPQRAYGPLIPPGELPEVATLTDTIPIRGVPVTASPDLQALRNAPRYADVPGPRRRPQTAMDILRVTNLDTAVRPDWVDSMYAGRAVQTPGAITDKDLILDAGISDTIAKTAEMQNGGLAAALEGYVRRGQKPVNAPRKATSAELAAAGQGQPWSAADGPLVSTRQTKKPVESRSAAELAALYQSGGPTRPAQAPGRKATAGQIAAVEQGGMPWSVADGPSIRLESAPRISTTRQTPGQSGTVLQNSEPMPQGTPKPRPQTERPRTQTYAGQEANPVPGRLPRIGPNGGPPLNNNAPKPATQSLDMAIRRAPGTVVSTVSSNPNIGQPPVERMVKTVPFSMAPKPATQSERLLVARSPGTTVATITPAEAAMARATELYRYGGPSTGLAGAPRLTANTVPGPNSPPKGQERLPTGFSIPNLSGTAPTLTAGIQVVPGVTQTADTVMANVPPPRKRPPRETAVLTELDIGEPMGGPTVNGLRNVTPPRRRPSRNPVGDFLDMVVDNVPAVRMARGFNTMMLNNGYRRGAPGSGVIYQRNAPFSVGQGPSTVFNQLRASGMSPAQAYAYANSGNNRLGVEDRITGAGTQASSGSSANSISSW